MGGLIMAVSALLALGVSVTPAVAATCSGPSCTSQDPYVTQCNAGDSIAGATAIVDAAGQTFGRLVLYWSPACQTNWGQAYFDDGNPPSTPPVDVRVFGSSSSATYDTGPVDFSTTASGSPVWGNMVYSPGCAYATVTRGGQTGTAVQQGCPVPGTSTGQPIMLPLLAPTTKCTATLCDGQDPYATACSTDGAVAANSPIVQGGATIGTLKLFTSSVCLAAWAQAYFNDGNPPSTPPVDVRVIGSDASAAASYDRAPIDFYTTGSGSPVWGNLAYSAGCTYATVTRGGATGQAVQGGCPAPGSPPSTSAPDVLNATGVSVHVAGGAAVSGVIARFSYADTAARSSDFTTAIDWGDGSGESIGQVVALNGHGAVNGTHRYPDPTQPDRATAAGYNVKVTIVGHKGGNATATSSVEVTGNYIPPSAGTSGGSSGSKKIHIGLGVLGTILDGAGCGLGLFGEVATAGIDTAETVLACSGAATSAAATAVAIHDPPDPAFQHVFRASIPRLGRIPKHCGHLRQLVCNKIHDAFARFLRTYVRAVAFAEDVGVTADRIGGAVRAHDGAATRRQRAAQRRYTAAWVAAVQTRHKAGRALSLLLQRHGLDRRISAAATARARQRLTALTRVSRADLTRLRREGLASTRAALRATLSQLLGWAPVPTNTTVAAVLAL
jgi:hypothetical protein